MPQNGENGHFAKKTYVPEGYKEGIKYTSTQPLEGRKRGFGTKDASKRDEFSNNIRTEQYRETLRKEMFFGEGPEVIKEKLTRLLADRASGDSTMLQDSGRRTFSCTVRQFDIGRSQVTDFDPKSIKDTYYKFDTEHDKFVGAMTKPVSQDIGNAAWEVPYKPPTFGGRSETRNFYDKSHLNIPAY